LDLVAAINFIPGPNSTELAIALGRLRGGWRGLFVAGFCFILPAVLIILPIGWLYVNYHALPLMTGIMRGVGAGIVAIVIAAVIRLAKSAITDRFAASIALLAALMEIINHWQRWALGDVSILAVAAMAGAIRRGGVLSRPRALCVTPLAVIGTGGLSLWGPVTMSLLFLKIGATLFGSGYLLVTYLQSSFVDHRQWLSQQQMLDAVAVGQVTPGPVLTTATFVGFVLGHDRFGFGTCGAIVCALGATAAIFAPSFVLVAILSRWLERLRSNPKARGALDAMNAAVAGLIAATCIWLAQQALAPPSTVISAMLMAASLLVLTATRINSTWIVLASGAIGCFLMSGHPAS
jgi:chromate transporter